jgi:hypothetical protein
MAGERMHNEPVRKTWFKDRPSRSLFFSESFCGLKGFTIKFQSTKSQSSLTICGIALRGEEKNPEVNRLRISSQFITNIKATHPWEAPSFQAFFKAV